MGLINNAIIICIFIGSFIDVSTSVPLYEASYDNIVRVSLLTEDSNPDLRVRRTADSNLPDHLSFAVPVQGDNVKLRLKRSRLLPTVTSDSLGTWDAGSFFQDAAVYTDMTRGSAMIVKRDTEGYTLKGAFVHANREWSMEPVERQRRDAGEQRFFRLHHLVPMEAKDTNISFVGDEVIDTEEREELVKIWRRQGKGKNQQHGQQRNRRPQLQLPPRETWVGSSLLGQRKQIGSNGEKRRGQNQRFKRAVTQHVVETAFVVDNADYQKWVTLVGSGEAITEMTLWYTYVAESVRIRYESIVDPDIAITTTVTVLKILTNTSDSDFIKDLTTPEGTFDGRTALDAFQEWVSLQTDIPESDHFMLFTGYDMDDNLAGMALTARACTAYGVSIAENSFYGKVGIVAAHEIGHSLSAKHDSQKGCNDSTQNIMSTKVNFQPIPGNEGHPWRFSPCSITSFKLYLKGKECTLPENTSGDDELPPPGPGQRAGEVLDRDTQCQLSQNYSDSYFCENLQASKGIEKLCGRMFCTREDGYCWTMVPQEYTPCNTGKWCRAGLCVDKPVETT